MKQTRIFICLALAFAVLAAQVGSVFAAPVEEETPLTGTVQSITLETDVTTAVTTVLVTLLSGDDSVTVRISLETAIGLGLVMMDENGMPVPNPDALGQTVQIEAADVIPDEEEFRHPVGSALAAFFSDIDGLDYETIMSAHSQGTGFGVIAQALWLTKKLEGNDEVFLAVVEAKKTGDYSAFFAEGETVPQNWGQFRKALSSGEKKANLGAIMSEKAKENQNNNGNAVGNGNSNAGGNGNGNAGGNNGNNGKGQGQDNGKGKGKDQ